jgi:hypothetical protein
MPDQSLAERSSDCGNEPVRKLAGYFARRLIWIGAASLKEHVRPKALLKCDEPRLNRGQSRGGDGTGRNTTCHPRRNKTSQTRHL